jgi:hypothetical protein
VLGTGELVTALLRIGQRLIKRLLCPRSDINGTGLRGNGATAELSAQPLEEQRRLESIELLEGSFDEAIWLAKKCEQEMLGVELVLAQTQQELLNSAQYFSRLFGKAF